MPLVLQENYTNRLLDQLRAGEIDCALLAEPLPEQQFATRALYDEPFLAAVPLRHPLAKHQAVTVDMLRTETVFLLGNGHCFRDHVLEVCPEFARFASDEDGVRRNFEGSSLETIKHMVAAGMGVTVVPRLSVPDAALYPSPDAPPWSDAHYVRYLPFSDVNPQRRVVLAWRRSYTRVEAIEALIRALRTCGLSGVRWAGGH